VADPLRRAAASVRVRATLGAVLVVAVVLVAAAVALLSLQRSTLRDATEDVARSRARQVVDQIAAGGPPRALAGRGDPDGDDDDDDDAWDEGWDDRWDDDAEPDEVVIQILDGGEVLASSQPGLRLPADEGVHEVPGGEHDYLVVTDEAEWDDADYTVVVGVSLEDVEESTAALVPLLVGGVPLVLLVVAGVTWLVIGRSLAPVERMRREVDAITDEHLDRRVETPASRDEVHRLATTMNAMLARLGAARDRQRRFVSDASHELRSPIATLRQTGEVARTHPDALGHDELVDTVLAESLRLQRLVDQLLVLTRTDEGRSPAIGREVDLDDLLVAEAARVRRERPDLAVDTAGIGPARVRANPVALDQVVRNLVDNATRHARSRLRLGVQAGGGWVRVTVSDDGAGVPPGERNRIFERFVRLDEARARDDGGSGLGLAIVREIVLAHGGRVWVSDEAGGGARFDVDLPAAPAAPA